MTSKMNNGPERLFKQVRRLADGRFMVFKDWRCDEKTALVLDEVGFDNLRFIQPPTNWLITGPEEKNVTFLFSKPTQTQIDSLNKTRPSTI